jgi:hypothetical protein
MEINKMKIVILNLFMFFINSLNAQEVKKITDNNLAFILSNIQQVKEFRNNDNLIKIHKIQFPNDTVPDSESHELLSRFFVSISETGEAPNLEVYEIGSFYNPKKIALKQWRKNLIYLQFEHGYFDDRRKIIYSIETDTLRLLEIKNL